MMDTKARIRQLMESRGWSEYRLAIQCGLSQSTISNIFARNNTPTVPTLEAVCNGMGITLSQFFAEGDMVEMTGDTKELFDIWANLTKPQKAALLEVAKNMH